MQTIIHIAEIVILNSDSRSEWLQAVDTNAGHAEVRFTEDIIIV